MGSELVSSLRVAGLPRVADTVELKAERRKAVVRVIRHGFMPAVRALLPIVSWLTAVIQVVRLRRWLRTDQLTGLAYRDALQRVFAHARRRHGPAVGLRLLDLDRFKQVNDRHGHATGDAVLRHAASHLAGAVGNAGLAVRLHGEFAVLLPRLPAGGAGQEAAHRVSERVARRWRTQLCSAASYTRRPRAWEW